MCILKITLHKGLWACRAGSDRWPLVLRRPKLAVSMQPLSKADWKIGLVIGKLPPPPFRGWGAAAPATRAITGAGILDSGTII